MINRETALLALQNALLGAVSPKLRAVGVIITSNSIQATAYFDGEIDEDDHQAMLLAETELMALFPEGAEIVLAAKRHDYPRPIPKIGAWAYLRREK